MKTILQAGGYSVDVAATRAEALSKLDEDRYDLVLSDAESGGRHLLAYARVKDYRPATALIKSNDLWSSTCGHQRRGRISVYTENLPRLLEDIAELIGARATRRSRLLRQAV